jgi:hypothetical protein
VRNAGCALSAAEEPQRSRRTRSRLGSEPFRPPLPVRLWVRRALRGEDIRFADRVQAERAERRLPLPPENVQRTEAAVRARVRTTGATLGRFDAPKPAGDVHQGDLAGGRPRLSTTADRVWPATAQNRLARFEIEYGCSTECTAKEAAPIRAARRGQTPHVASRHARDLRPSRSLRPIFPRPPACRMQLGQSIGRACVARILAVHALHCRGR